MKIYDSNSYNPVILLCFFCCSLFLVSCDKDDDKDGKDNVKPKTESGPVVGNWDLTEDGYKDCDDPANNYVDINNCNGDGMCVNRTFNSDGTYSIQGDWTENGTYTISGNTITLCESTNDCDDHTFTIENDVLTLSDPSRDGCTYYTMWHK